MTDDKMLKERIRKKWGNEKAAWERRDNKAIAAGEQMNAGNPTNAIRTNVILSHLQIHVPGKVT